MSGGAPWSPSHSLMQPIYLDHAALSPLRPEVAEAMQPHLSHRANPSSLHRWGRRASGVLEEARADVGRTLGVDPGEVYFVRGGTEASNLAILGRAGAERRAGRPVRVLLSAIEHRAVLDTADGVRALGGEAIILPVDAASVPEDAPLSRALELHSAVLSLMSVNNETGALPPVSRVSALCRDAGVPFHTDAVQAPGHIPLAPLVVAADLLSLSGHKIGGPGSAGILVVRRGIEVSPLLHGGGQERGLRPGTEDVPGAVGMAEALRLAVSEEGRTASGIGVLRDRLETLLQEGIPDLRIHGAAGLRAPHILNVGVPGVDPGLLVPALDLEGIGASRGSACSSGGERVSHVLEALLGAAGAREAAALRLSLGRDTTEDEITRAAAVIVGVVGRMRAAAGVEP